MPRLHHTLLVATITAGSMLAQARYELAVVYVNEVGHPTNVVPGTGLPFNLGGGSNSAYNRPWVSSNGQHWALVVAIESPSLGSDEALLLDGQLVLREGQPAPWPTPGEVVGQFFFSEVGINDAGDLLFDNATGTPSVPSPAATNDYVARYDRATNTWSLIAQELQPVNTILPTLVGNGGGLATWDDNLDTCRLMNNGTMLWRADGIDGLTTGVANDAVVHLGGGLALQKGVDIPVGQVGGGLEQWENFDQGRLFAAFDGALVLVQGDLTGAATTDDVVVLNGAVILQEGVAFGPFTSPIDAGGVAKCWLDDAGSYYVRGDNVDQTDWVLRNTFVVATTDGTSEIVAGSGEHWDDSIYTPGFFGFDGNSLGHWLLAGATDHPDVNRNAVIIIDDNAGTRLVAAREGDPIDLNGNGLFDDDRFLATFGDDDMQLLDDGTIMFLATLRDGAGVSVSHAFIRLSPRTASCALRNGSGSNPVACLCTTLPIVGQTFQVTVAPGPATVFSLLYASPTPLAPLPIFGWGEVLIGPEVFEIPQSIPALPFAFTGLRFSLQGLRFDAIGSTGAIVLTNAQDIVIGN